MCCSRPSFDNFCAPVLKGQASTTNVIAYNFVDKQGRTRMWGGKQRTITTDGCIVGTIPFMQKIPALLISTLRGIFRASQASPNFRTESSDSKSTSITCSSMLIGQRFRTRNWEWTIHWVLWALVAHFLRWNKIIQVICKLCKQVPTSLRMDDGRGITSTFSGELPSSWPDCHSSSRFFAALTLRTANTTCAPDFAKCLQWTSPISSLLYMP